MIFDGITDWAHDLGAGIDCAAVKELPGGKPTLTAATEEDLTTRVGNLVETSSLTFLLALCADVVASELARGESATGPRGDLGKRTSSP